MRKLLMTIVASALLCSSNVNASEAAMVWASWYGPGFHGNKTASGERFNQYSYTAAHKTLPFGSVVAVSYKGKTIHVRINDRGPYVRGRALDLSRAAARALNCDGICKVDMKVIFTSGKVRKKGA